jgi:hypothetical protein
MPEVTISFLLQGYGGVILLFGIVYYVLWVKFPHEFIVG